MKTAKRLVVLGAGLFALGLEMKAVLWALSEYLNITLPLTEKQAMTAATLSELAGVVLFTFGLAVLHFSKKRRTT
jgi:hypothetical protein